MADQLKQNDFLMSHIEIRAVQRRSIEMKNPKKIQRRVSCKYKVPVLTSKDPPIQPGASPEGVMVTEVCQKAFMNIYAITEKRVRLQREKLISQTYLVSAAGEQPVVKFSDFFNSPTNLQNTQTPMTQTEYINNLNKDMALVDNFFMNQLWKPDKLTFHLITTFQRPELSPVARMADYKQSTAKDEDVAAAVASVASAAIIVALMAKI
ncbi:unnamed protein product, partial [Timema podura]|nr:unnamed protein product [Timema podura]